METYTKKPLPVEVFGHSGQTDVIIRKNITYTEKPATENEAQAQEAWTCEEVQFRYPGPLTKEQVEADLDGWWNYTPEKPTPPKTLEELETEVAELKRSNTQLHEALDLLLTGGTV